MKTRSAKAKGKRLENYIKDRLIDIFSLTTDDIRCTIGSETGEDIKLSKKALKLLPIKIEAKSRAKISVYNWYTQASKHKGEALEPVLIIKQNRSLPLAVIDLEYFLSLLKKIRKE